MMRGGEGIFVYITRYTVIIMREMMRDIDFRKDIFVKRRSQGRLPHDDATGRCRFPKLPAQRYPARAMPPHRRARRMTRLRVEVHYRRGRVRATHAQMARLLRA